MVKAKFHHAILPSCTSTKLLGIVINNSLSFKDHINNLQTKNLRLSSLDLLENLGWMSVEDRCNYFTSIPIYKCLHSSSSHILSYRFVRATDAHCYITRYTENNNLQVPKPNSNS